VLTPQSNGGKPYTHLPFTGPSVTIFELSRRKDIVIFRHYTTVMKTVNYQDGRRRCYYCLRVSLSVLTALATVIGVHKILFSPLMFGDS
jgi:hypothetical protein